MKRSTFGEISPTMEAVLPTSLWLRLRVAYTRSKIPFHVPYLPQFVPQLLLSHKVIIQKLTKVSFVKGIDVGQGKLQPIQSHKRFFQLYLSFPVMSQSAKEKLAVDY